MTPNTALVSRDRHLLSWVVRGKEVISSIYAWWPEDFGGSWNGVIEHLKKYARPELARQLATEAPIDHDYDWGLNEP